MEKTGGFGLNFFKGLLIGVSVCLAAILIFAFVLKFAEISEGWIKFINQVIKLFGITAACLVGVKGEKGFLKGAAIGLAVVAVTYLLFGLISGSLTFGVSTLFEAGYGLICGSLAGILAANLKK